MPMFECSNIGTFKHWQPNFEWALLMNMYDYTLPSKTSFALCYVKLEQTDTVYYNGKVVKQNPKLKFHLLVKVAQIQSTIKWMFHTSEINYLMRGENV